METRIGSFKPIAGQCSPLVNGFLVRLSNNRCLQCRQTLIEIQLHAIEKPFDQYTPKSQPMLIMIVLSRINDNRIKCYKHIADKVYGHRKGPTQYSSQSKHKFFPKNAKAETLLLAKLSLQTANWFVWSVDFECIVSNVLIADSIQMHQ
ncbi:hypothetical protein BLOT_004469 [Blomia tropicalis]|nr:hypothetical protein BLOT_004469 [Blomia tropicalis]